MPAPKSGSIRLASDMQLLTVYVFIMRMDAMSVANPPVTRPRTTWTWSGLW